MKRNYLNLLAVIVLAMTVACSSKPEGADAEVSEAQEVEEVQASKTYSVQADKSEVSWIGSKPTGKHNGTIPISNGSIKVADGKIVGGNIDMKVSDIKNEDLADNEEMQGKLVGHLKSADFFDAEQHPNANFTIISVEKYSGDENMEVKEEYDTEYKPAAADEYMVESPTHKITGNLTMRGKTLSVSFPANVKVSDNEIKAKAKFNIDRTQWGLMYGDEASAVDKAKDKFIYNTVNVGFDVVAAIDSM